MVIINLLSRNREGRVVKPAPFQSSMKSGEVARLEPNHKWFGMSTDCYLKSVYESWNGDSNYTQSRWGK